MDGIVAGCRILNSKVVLLVAADRVIIKAALGTTNLETREYRLMRATIVRQITSVLCGALFGVDVDNTTGPETELGGQRASDQIDAFHPVRIDLLAEPGDALRNQNVINSKLEIGVFAADVELPKRIL